MLASIRRRTDHKPCVHASVDQIGLWSHSSSSSDALRVLHALDDAALMRSRRQVQRRQARVRARVVLFSGKSSARLRVRRRASSWSSRRRGPERGEFEMGGGVFKHKTRRQTPTTFEKSPQGAQRKPRCGDDELVLVAVCWFRDSRGPERGRENRRRNQVQFDARPISSGAAAGARRRQRKVLAAKTGPGKSRLFVTKKCKSFLETRKPITG